MQPGEKLIVALAKLQHRLSTSGVERTFGLLQAMGNDCSFYRKSLDIFLDRDYDDLESLITIIQDEFEQLKGTNNE